MSSLSGNQLPLIKWSLPGVVCRSRCGLTAILAESDIILKKSKKRKKNNMTCMELFLFQNNCFFQLMNAVGVHSDRYAVLNTLPTKKDQFQNDSKLK